MSEPTAYVTAASGAVREIPFEEADARLKEISDRASQEGVEGWDVAVYAKNEMETSDTQIVGYIVRVLDIDPAKAAHEAVKKVPKLAMKDGGTLKINVTPIGVMFDMLDES